jgi:hypothetical protein
LPSRTYFHILEWLIKHNSTDLPIRATNFIGTLKRFEGYQYAHLQCFNFIYFLSQFSEERFSRSLFSKFLGSWANGFPVSTVTVGVKFLKFSQRFGNDDVIKSECFRILAAYHFGESQCGREILECIEALVDDNNVKMVWTALWEESVLHGNVHKEASLFFVVIRKLLMRFPRTAEWLWKSRLHTVLWEHVKNEITRKTDRLERRRGLVCIIAKVLGEFNFSCCKVAKERKSTAKGKKLESLAKHWKQEGMTISVVVAGTVQAWPAVKGRSGLFYLLRSLIHVSPTGHSDFLAMMTKNTLIGRCMAESRIHAANLLMSWSLMYDVTVVAVQRIMVKEFAAAMSCTDLDVPTASKMCEGIQRLYSELSSELRATVINGLDRFFVMVSDVRLLTSSVCCLVFGIENEAVSGWMSQVIRLLSGEVCKGIIADKSGLVAIAGNIRVLLNLIKMMKRKNEVLIPRPTVDKDEIMGLANSLQDLETVEGLDASSMLVEFATNSCVY